MLTVEFRKVRRVPELWEVHFLLFQLSRKLELLQKESKRLKCVPRLFCETFIGKIFAQINV